MEIRCYCKILHISYKDYVTNEEARACNGTTQRSLDHRKETHSEVVWQYILFIRSGQTILQGTVKGGKKTRQTEEEVGRQHQGMDRPGIHQVPEGSWEQRTMEETGCEVICGAKGRWRWKLIIKQQQKEVTLHLPPSPLPNFVMCAVSCLIVQIFFRHCTCCTKNLTRVCNPCQLFPTEDSGSY